MPCCDPLNAVPMTIKAEDVRPDDILDDRQCGRGGLNRITSYWSNRDGTMTLTLAGNAQPRAYMRYTHIKVWRPVANCPDACPLDFRADRPFRNLSEVHHAGDDGLRAAFPVGSVWEVGPFVNDRDPEVVVVTGKPYTQGRNHSQAREDADALGNPTWFIPTTVLWTPFSERKPSSGQPPHVLASLTDRMARKAGVPCNACCRPSVAECSCCSGMVCEQAPVTVALRATVNALRCEVTTLAASLRGAESDARLYKRLRDDVERKLNAVQEALR